MPITNSHAYVFNGVARIEIEAYATGHVNIWLWSGDGASPEMIRCQGYEGKLITIQSATLPEAPRG